MKLLNGSLLLCALITPSICLFSNPWIKSSTVFLKPIVSPVIYIPGYGGSQIEAKLDKPSVVHYLCQQHRENYYKVWLNLKLLLPVFIDCWVDNVKLYYDNETRTTNNAPGVTTRIPGWGSSDAVEWLTDTHSPMTGYFKDIGNVLVELGYEKNFSIRGAPYDFRKAPNENQLWFIDLKYLIESTFFINGNIRVTLLAHSMGGPMTLLFLQRQSQEWKDKFIYKFISLSASWGGSVKAVKVYAVGDNLGAPIFNQAKLREEQITNPSLAWMLPSTIFWKSDEVLIEMKSRNYTMGELEDFLIDLDYPIGWEMRKDTQKFTEDFTPPGVEVHCIFGTNVGTVEKLVYKSDDLRSNPKLVDGLGDGTVNARSLDACKLWAGQQTQNVYFLELPGRDHMAVLSDRIAVKYIVDILNKY